MSRKLEAGSRRPSRPRPVPEAQSRSPRKIPVTTDTATDADFGQAVNQVNGQPQSNPSPSLSPGGFFLLGARAGDDT